MIGAIIVLIVLGAVLTVIFRTKGKGVGKGTGFSIRRGASTHYNVDGKPKRSYATLNDAQVAAARHSREGTSMSAYRCRDCGHYHVGHA